MTAHVLPPLAVNSKSEQKVNLLPSLGFEPVNFEMLAHLSDHSAKCSLLQLLYCNTCSSTCRRAITQLKGYNHFGLEVSKFIESEKELE
jgi:hypothetical protein